MYLAWLSFPLDGWLIRRAVHTTCQFVVWVLCFAAVEVAVDMESKCAVWSGNRNKTPSRSGQGALESWKGWGNIEGLLSTGLALGYVMGLNIELEISETASYVSIRKC